MVIDGREQRIQAKCGGQSVRGETLQIVQPFACSGTTRLEDLVSAAIEARDTDRDSLDLRSIVRE